MSRTYKTTGIILKTLPMGEADRLVTLLTQESGIVRAIAPGARKHKSRLGGRTGLFVVNQLMLSRGKSLDRILQAETVQSFPALSADLGRLTASQYLSELVLCEAVSELPQQELYDLVVAFLVRLEQVGAIAVLAELAQATVHLLRLAGIAPEVYQCCATGQPVQANLDDPSWRVGFSTEAGGVVRLSALGQLEAGLTGRRGFSTQLRAAELVILQELCQSDLVLTQGGSLPSELVANPAALEIWRRIERLLRHYAQHHFDRTIRSAALIDTCFSTLYAS